MNLIDTHLHFDAPEFAADAAERWALAQAAGVAHAIVPAVMADTFDETLAVAARFGMDVALGLHPLYLASHQDAHLAVLERYLAQGKAVAVGECGLDGYVPGLDPQRQEALLLAQLKLARRFDLPVILHIRRAQDRVLKCLRQVPVRGGIAHAFNGSEQQARAFIDLGFCLGFGGAMTYQGSQRIRRLAASLPLSALVLETDGPDIPPEWAQGVPNGPENLPRMAAVLAELRGMPLAELARATAENVRRVIPALRTIQESSALQGQSGQGDNNA
jgi:TatD DNase family protein